MRQINIDAFMKLYKSVSNVYMPQSQHFEARHPNRNLQRIRVYTSTTLFHISWNCVPYKLESCSSLHVTGLPHSRNKTGDKKALYKGSLNVPHFVVNHPSTPFLFCQIHSSFLTEEHKDMLPRTHNTNSWHQCFYHLPIFCF